jgi:hypothetical protein
MYSIVYRRYDLPEVNLDFKTESAMFAYVNTWINGDEDYIAYFYNGIEYDPPWTR